MAELREAGLWDKYKRPSDMRDTSFKLLVLLSTQTALLRNDRDRIRQQINDYKVFRSPLWYDALYEPDPLKQQELRKQAEADERRAKEEVRRFGVALSQRPWVSRDQKQQPYDAVVWNKPMTTTDYHHATGLSRRTIHNMLKRLKAKPIAKPVRVKDPARYSESTNLAVLSEWLLKHVKKLDHRRAYYARTWLKCFHESPDRMLHFVDATLLVIEVT